MIYISVCVLRTEGNTMVTITTQNQNEVTLGCTNNSHQNRGWLDVLRTVPQGWRYLSVAIAVWHERQQLAELAERELKDLDIDPIDARLESKRSFFDIPKDRLSGS